MATPRYKFTLTKGEDSEKSFQWKNAQKQPISLAGYQIECKLFSDDQTVFKTLVIGDGISLNASNDKFTISFHNSITTTILSPYSKYEVWFTLPDSKRKCFLVGQLSFIEP